MSKHQKAVLWVGLILILLNLVFSASWAVFKGTLFGAPPKGKKSASGKGSAQAQPTNPLTPLIPPLAGLGPTIIGIGGTTPANSQAGGLPINA